MNDIPQPLKTIATRPQEKLYVLHLETELIVFIKESILLKNESPLYIIHAGVLKNSYYRLLSHQICQHYHLQHWNNGSNDIIVTLSSDGFDYEKFIERLELKEDNSFTKISDYLQQRQGGNSGNTSEGDETTAKVIRPKMIIKKESPKRHGPTASADTFSGTTQASAFLTLGTQNVKAQNYHSDAPCISTPVVTSSSNPMSDNIEVERASKEALYMKVREKIFQDQQDEEDDQEEYTEDDDEDDSDEDTANSSTSDVKSGFINQDNIHKQNRYNESNFALYQYNDGPHSVPPAPIGMPLNYNEHMNLPPYINPNGYYNSPNQSMYPPHINPYNNYANCFPDPPMMPPQNGFYTNAYNGNHHYSPYDKETERKLLNNPYIIIPDTDREKKHKKPYKGRYTNGYSNSPSSTTKIPTNNSTKF